ncbi:MAG: hypothetical protein VW600_01470 [Ferrovibrio sp.]
MTARMADIKDCPTWPRGLSEEQAAAYVGVSVGTFRSEVEAGIWPPADRRGPEGKRKVWDRTLLDQAFDRRSSIESARAAGMASGTADDWTGRLPQHGRR